jgi:hypothetical protein
LLSSAYKLAWKLRSSRHNITTGNLQNLGFRAGDERMRKAFLIFLWLFSLLSFPLAANPITYSFTAIDFPGSTLTTAVAINDSGQVIGTYSSNGVYHGYLLSGDSLSTIDPPGSTFTDANGINDSRELVGTYTTSDGITHGFLATPTPEPDTLVLTVSAIGLVAVWSWRRRWQSSGR